MPILHRYVLRQFISVFVICFCSLTGLFVVIDGFGNLDEFIAYASPTAAPVAWLTHGSLLRVMGEYYAYQSLTFFDRTSPILTLIAAMFTLTWIQRHNELTAIQAAGIAKSRILTPIIAAVIVISILAAANREFVIPSARGALSHNAQDLGGTSSRALQSRRDYDTDILMQGQEVFDEAQRIGKPSFALPRNLDRYGKRLRAEEAVYVAPQGDRPGGYLLRKLQQPKDLDRDASLTVDGKPILITPADASWLKSGECFVVSYVTFEQLTSGAKWKQLASTSELIRGLHSRNLEFGADVRVAVHSRLIQPVLDVTLLFLGIPLVLSRSNRNIFLAIGLCAGVVVAFMLMVLGCQYMGSSYFINPALAAWLPLLIFVPAAVGLSDPLRE